MKTKQRPPSKSVWLPVEGSSPSVVNADDIHFGDDGLYAQMRVQQKYWLPSRRQLKADYSNIFAELSSVQSFEEQNVTR
ncbi:hypothetical protein [Thaumasiovibrio sp. DFM-14]|uniref:hypothetical protein n=1 Tax=Thaumasiovibrio sp. DFM-14 TaxID=3384792 RepID=UPI00399FAF0B